MNVNQILEANKQAAKTVAIIKVGEAANAVTAKALKKVLPWTVQGLVDQPVGRYLIGNVLNQAIKHGLKDNAKAQLIGEAALTAGIKSLADKVDVDKIINGLLGSTEVQAAIGQAIDTPAAAAE